MVLGQNASSAYALISNFCILCAGLQDLPHLRFCSLSEEISAS